MHPILHIKLLGSVGIEYGGDPVYGIDTPRLQSLLAYLLLHADAPEQRRYLAFRFWPDSTEKQARTNLRQLLHHLRKALPDVDRFIETDTHTLQWRPDAPFTLDVAAFGQALANAKAAEDRSDISGEWQALENGVGLYRDDLLPGCYDEWIEPERERLRQQYIGALDRLVRLLEQERRYLEAIRHAGRLLQKDPLRETTYRTMMRLYALRDDRASALRIYHRCATILDRELSVEPGPATRQLYESLLNMRAPAKSRNSEEARGRHADSPLVGRRKEWNQLRAAWHTATSVHANAALIAGEAGIGKSRLAEELLTWAARQGVTTARARCYAAEGRLALAPTADWLREDAFQFSVRKLDEVWRTEVARILPELLVEKPDLPSPGPLTSWQRRHFFEALARAVLAAPQPMVLVVDDLQWCDQDTLEWLHFLLRFDMQAQLLIVGTVRSEEIGPDHPLQPLLLDLRRTGLVQEISLVALSPDETTALAELVAARSIEASHATFLYEYSEGNPLFVVEIVRAGTLVPDVNPVAPTLDAASIPADIEMLPPKVHAVLAARLSQCTPRARELAHLAAVVGRAFTFEILAAASDRDQNTLMHGLDELWRRRIVRAYGPDAYDFTHDRLREVAYAEMSPVKRRRSHRSVAEALETIHAGNLDAVSGRLASHYEQAGLPDKALAYYQRAAHVACHMHANEEAIIHLNRALAVLEGRRPSPQRDAAELVLLVLLGSSVAATRGFAESETGRIYARARKLCRSDEDPRLCFPVYWGSYAFNLVRADLRKAHADAERCLVLAQAEEDPTLLAAAHFAIGVSIGHLGQLSRSREHLERAHARYDPEQHYVQIGTDPGVFTLAYLSHTLWLLGYADEALQHARDGLALANELAHPFSRTIALSYLAMLHQFRGESELVLAHAESALALCAEHRFPYYEAWGTIMTGWALHQRGECEGGKAQMVRGLNDFRKMGTGLRVPHYLALLAGAQLEDGRLEEALSLLRDALPTVGRTGERWQEAELHRLKGEIVQDADDAEGCFRQALGLARKQNARSLELRAATSLSRLWQRTRRHDDARRLLQNVCDAFTEGFGVPDFQEARALLHTLS